MRDLLIKSKVGFQWTLGGNILRSIFGLSTLFLLTYYVGPGGMGIVSIVTAVYGIAETIAHFGISQSIISRNSQKSSELTGIFFVNIVLGCITASMLFFLAPYIAQYYSQQSAQTYLQLIAVAFFIEPFGLLFRVLLEKDLEFRMIEMINLSKSVIIFAVTAVLLILGFGITGYVTAILASACVTVLLLWGVAYKKNALFVWTRFRFSDLTQHYHFGVLVTLRSCIHYISRNMDELIIGKILGLEVLGIYYFAKKVMERPAHILSGSFTKVAFPLFAKLRAKNIDDVATKYLKIVHILALLGSFLFGLAVVVTPYVIPRLFGEVWTESVYLIQIFAGISFIYLLTDGILISILYSLHKPRFVFVVEVCVTMLRLVLLLLVASLGIHAVAYALGATLIVKCILLQHRVNNMLHIPMRTYLTTNQLPLFYAICGIVSSLIIGYVLVNYISFYFLLLILVTVYVSVFAVVLVYTNKPTAMMFKKEIYSLFRNIIPISGDI